MNLYAFVENDGINKADRFGLLGFSRKDDCDRYNIEAKRYLDAYYRVRTEIMALNSADRKRDAFNNRREAKSHLLRLKEEKASYAEILSAKQKLDHWYAVTRSIRWNIIDIAKEASAHLEKHHKFIGEYLRCKERYCPQNGFYCRFASGILGGGLTVAGFFTGPVGGTLLYSASVVNSVITVRVCEQVVLPASSVGAGALSLHLQLRSEAELSKKVAAQLAKRSSAAAVIDTAINWGPIIFAGSEKPSDF